MNLGQCLQGKPFMRDRGIDMDMDISICHTSFISLANRYQRTAIIVNELHNQHPYHSLRESIGLLVLLYNYCSTLISIIGVA